MCISKKSKIMIFFPPLSSFLYSHLISFLISSTFPTLSFRPVCVHLVWEADTHDEGRYERNSNLWVLKVCNNYLSVNVKGPVIEFLSPPVALESIQETLWLSY